MKPLKIGLAQLNPIMGDIQGNTKKVQDAYLDACHQGMDVMVTPELCLCGYPPDDLMFRPEFYTTIQQSIEKLRVCTQSHSTGLILGTPWAEHGQMFNAALVIHQGVISHIHRKSKLPNQGVFDDCRWFSPGTTEPVAIRWNHHWLGLVICEEIWTDDVVAAWKDQPIDMLVVLNASPYEINKHQLRVQTVTKAVKTLGCPVVYVNMVGGQDDLVYDGRSFVMTPEQNIPCQYPAWIEGLWSWDPQQMNDKIPEKTLDSNEYEFEEDIFLAMTTGLKNYIHKNGFCSVILGLSGGIDSAVVLCVAAHALGPQNVQAVMMPGPYTDPISIDDAKTLAQNVDVNLRIIPMSEMFEMYCSHLGNQTTWTDLGYQNLQSRIRAMILMSISNNEGPLLLSTGNKSELATGYATLYGDMCGAFNPLKDVYKTQVYQIARWINHRLWPSIIPDRILTRPPSAELRPNQTDQDNLPPYEILDKILYELIENERSIADLVDKGYNHSMVDMIATMLRTNEYKRKQAPPGPKISTKAFGRDRRYPITNQFRALVNDD